MAEYAGLEIRIGGNTTKLTNALRASTKSAADLQSRIRQATKAMQFDPTNLKNVDTRIQITGDRMQSLQSKAQIMRTAMKQLGETMTTVLDSKSEAMSVKRLAEETDNLSLAAKQADERFGKMTGSLAQIYEAWNKVSRKKGSDTLVKELGFSDDEAQRLMRSTTTLRDFVDALREEQALRSSFGYDGGKPPITDAQIAMMKEFKELDFHGMFKRGVGLDDMLKEAENLGVVIEDKAVATVRDLQKEFKKAQDEKKAFDSALTYEKMGTDLQRIDSEAESLSQTMRKLDDALTPTAMTDDFQAIEAQVRSVDAAIKNVDDDLKRTGEALKVDPGNIELSTRYFNDLQQKAALTAEKTELLKRELDMLNADGAQEAIKGHQDLAKWVEESAESARKANKELSEQRATVANLDDQTKGLRQSIAMLKGDSSLAEFSDNVLEWKSRTEQLTKAMDELGKKEREVATEQGKLSDAQAAFDKAQSEAEQYKSQLEELRAEYQRLTSSMESTGIFDEADLARVAELQNEIEQVEIAYNGAEQEVKEFNRELDDQKDRAKNAQSALDQQQAAVDELVQTIAKLEETREVKLFQNPTDEIEKLEAELVDLEGELDQAKAKENELEAAYDSAKSENELAKTAQAARGVSQEMDATAASAKKVAQELDLKNDSILNPSTLKSIGMTLSATVTPLITALGYKMVDASSMVDAAYRDMRKTVDGTEEQFEHLRSAAIDFSRTHVTSADQILQIEAIGGELGIATENLEKFAEVISNIDVASNLDVEGAAEALGHLANILHLSVDDYEGFSDALVRLGNNGASTESEIANIAERIGSMGAIVGMSGSDILAWASTIASTGQNAEAAGTAISKTISFMETAVSAAGGTLDTSFESINAAVEEGGDRLTVFASLAGMTAEEFAQSWETNSEEMAETLNSQLEGAKDSLQMIADIAHMSADEFAKAWESDPTEVLKAFINGLNDIEGAEGSADKVLQDLGITAVRQKQAIEGLMQTVGGLDNNLRMSEDAWNGVSDQWGEAGDAANEAAKKAEGFSGQMQILKNIGQNFLTELGEGAVPWVKTLSSQLQVMANAFSGLSDGMKKWLVFAGGATAAAGPILSMVATLLTAKGEYDEWVNNAVSGMSIVKMAFASGGQEAVDSLMATMSAMDKMKMVAKQLGSSLLKGLAVGAVVGGIVLIAAQLKKLYDEYQTHIAATKGLSRALAEVGSVTDVTIRNFGMTGSTLRSLAADSRQYESRLADLTSTIEDSNRQYGAYAGSLDYYASTIETLGSKSDRSKEEAYKLEAALQAVNDACGTTYGLDQFGNIIDTETGKVQANTDAILANIDARKNQALIDYYSDDYVQAVGEHAEAQERLNEAQEAYNTLLSDEGRKEFFDNAKEVYGATYDEAKVQAAYNQQLKDAETAIANYQTEVNKTGDVIDRLDERIANANEGLRKSQQVLEDAAKAQEEFDRRNDTMARDVTGNMKRMSDAINSLGKSDTDFNNIAEGLAAIHVNADELGKVDMVRLASAFDDANGSMEQIIASLEEGGVQMWTWNAALEQAPDAAEKMGSLTAAAFQSMYEIAGSDLNATMTLIAGLDSMQIGDKTFYIGDNGSIVDSQGRIYSIQNDLAALPEEVITAYYVDDSEAMQKALDTKAALQDVDKQNPTPTINVNDKATRPTDTLQGKLNSMNSYSANPSAYLKDYASPTINSIRTGLINLDGRSATVTVTTVEKTVKQATGGMNNRPVIPRHATGYIATGPTLTNQGWIGEDGVEAVANWATGGAVVPLTNKKYMLPIADAIAEGMVSKQGAFGGQTYNLYLDGLRINDDEAIRQDVLNLLSDLRRRANMNNG